MKKLRIFTVMLLMLIFASTAHTWNLDAKYINALIFKKDGTIRFTLFANGTSGEEFKCQGTSPWFQISPCPPDNAACIVVVNRMGSMLLGAKLSGKPVHIERDGCDVTEVALKP